MWKHIKRQNFSDPTCTLPSERLEYNTHYTDTLYWLGYKARATLSSSRVLYIAPQCLACLSFRPLRYFVMIYGVSAWGTMASRARFARSFPFVSSFLLPSFLPLATVSVAWVYLACNFLVDSREMPGKDAPKDAFDPTWTKVVASHRGCFELSFNAVSQ